MNAHMPGRRRRLLIAGAALAAITTPIAIAIAVVGLGRADDNEPSAHEGDSTFLELLALIPDRAETRFDLVLIDYDRFFSGLGMQRPRHFTSDSEEEAFEIRLAAESHAGNLPLVYGQGAAPGVLAGLGPNLSYVTQKSRLGYSLAEADGYVFAGRNPEAYEAVIGIFDRRRVTETISHCEDCSLTASRKVYAGFDYYVWDDQFRNNLRIRPGAPVFDDLGKAGRLAATSRFVMRTNWPAGIERMLDASAGNLPSLADNEDFVLMVGALDSMHAASAYVSACTLSRARVRAGLDALSPDERYLAQVFWGTQESEVVLKPYQVFAVAAVLEGEPSAALVFLHETPELAQANVDRLRHRFEFSTGFLSEIWRDVYSHLDITTDGRLLLARLYGVNPAAILPLGAPFLIHE